jgi:hypothetical protein
MNRFKLPAMTALIAAMVSVIVLAGCSVPSAEPVDTSISEASEVRVETTIDNSEELSNESTSQQNAREKAQDYLKFQSFSRSGLIGQLEFEGFSNSDSVYAVDSLNIDWSEQAAKKGAEYMKSSPFSRQGLLDQLLFEGFTPEQAEYGVSTSYGAGSTEDSAGSGSEGSVAQVNAVEKAKDYLKFQSFSRSGLIGQLEFEGFSNSDATYAVDSLVIDWNEQAAKTARSYLDSSSFSRQSLLDQLLFEGFTQAQAEYGVSSVGM